MTTTIDGIPTRAYFIIDGAAAQAHPELFDRPEIGTSSADTIEPMPASGDFLVLVQGVGTDAGEVTADGLEAVAPAVLSRLKGALMSRRRAQARVYGEYLHANYTIGAADGDPEKELRAKAADQGVDLSGLALKRDIVRALMRARYPEVATPRMTASEARAWAESKSPAFLSAYTKARGLYVDHAPDKATAIEWLLSAEGYQA